MKGFALGKSQNGRAAIRVVSFSLESPIIKVNEAIDMYNM